MAKFEITETRPISGVRIWRYEVEADNADEALEKVLNGDIEAESCTEDYDDDNDEDSEYEVEEAE